MKIVAYREVTRDQLPLARLRKFRALPTWLVTMLAWPLFRLKGDHPWRNRSPFTLMEWWKGQTAECRTLDLQLWLCFTLTVAMTVRVATMSSQ